MLLTRCGRAALMAGQRHMSVNNTCHDSRLSEIMTTCSIRRPSSAPVLNDTNRTMSDLKKHAILRCPRLASFRRSTVWSTPCSGWAPSYCFVPSFALPFEADAVMWWPSQSVRAQ